MDFVTRGKNGTKKLGKYSRKVHFYIEKIENQVNDSGQSSIVPYGSDELEIYENILTPLKVEHVHVVASKKTG